MDGALVQISWSGLQAGLKSGKYDLICGSMAITPARRENMAFSLPYYVSGAQIFGLDGKQPRRCGVTESSTYATYISEHPEEFAETRVVSYGDEATILTAIEADKLDGFVSDRIVGGYYLSRSNASGVEPVGDLLYREACGIACRPDEPELLRSVNEALFGLVNSGEYEEICRRWVGQPPDLDLLFGEWGSHSDLLATTSSSSGPTLKKAESSTGSTLRLLARGALLTVQLSLLTAVISLGSGLLLALGTVSPQGWARALAQGYVLLIRGTPLLVQLFLSYFVVATALNRLAGQELMGAYLAALLALVINTTAYNCETIRGGIQGVSKGQWDAAKSLGMTRTQSLRRIILPQALRTSIPSLGNNLVVLVKDTSLVGAITLIELTYAARNVVFQKGEALLPFLLAALFYLAIISLLSVGV